MKLFGILSVIITIAGSSTYAEAPKKPTSPSSITITEGERSGIQFKKIADTVWLHTSYKEVKGWGSVLSNGLIVLTESGAVLVDTAWDNDQTNTILEWTKDTLGIPITSAVFTHAHDDKMGGVKAVIDSGAATYAHPKSNLLAPTENLVPAEFDLVISKDGSAVPASGRPKTDLSGLDVFYAGAGHTEDNIVMGIRGMDILFGGCLIRPGNSTNLGNTASASITDWPLTIERVAERFPNAKIVIPSHGAPAGRELLTLTAKLGLKAKNGMHH